MSDGTKSAFLRELKQRFGPLRKLAGSESLYELTHGAVTVYVRYSRVHGGQRTFYGLRQQDLQRLEGIRSVICFLWDGQATPLFLPFSDYEEVFRSTSPAGDGQYKVQVFLHEDATQLYIAQAGRFNVEGSLGWGELEKVTDIARAGTPPDLSHCQVQTLLGAIGAAKTYEVWIPPADRGELDWSLSDRYACSDALPYQFDRILDILREVDVVWIHRGSGKLRALFEVEESTPIYSGLLRLNDVYLTDPSISASFSVAAKDARRPVFVRQLNRPTFQLSGLSKLCAFLEYANVFAWYNRTRES